MIHSEYGICPPFEGTILPECPLLFGCEYEIEDLVAVNTLPMGIHIETDGSLRNNGKEFITSPQPLEDSVELFSMLHSELAYGAEAFSDRTSIHVHVNCLNLELDEVRNIVLLYALFEESFFSLVNSNRRDNIHCVALTETFLPSIYRVGLSTMVARWHKYTALNLKPLATLGTLEFRHMHGHSDPILLRMWLTVITKLFEVGKTFIVSKETISEDSLQKLFYTIFNGTPLIKHWHSIRATMGNQILDVKLSTL